MTASAIMLQGTGSDVGKSLITAALCRIARKRGLRVAPFKPQNMSNNAAVCANGGEIGRAQALQARAAGLEPSTDMNPVLLKPQSDRDAQVVIQGSVDSTQSAAAYFGDRSRLMIPVMESFAQLCATYDLVLVEGAGSPAEINLRERDIANMGFARAAGVPVCLIGDIDKGGVIASLVGTKAVIDPADSAMIRAFLVNKFRGDPALFNDGVQAIETATDWPCLGVVPWIASAALLPAEDAVALDQTQSSSGKVKIAAPMLSRIANFDDADPIRLEPDVDLQWIPPGQPLPRDCDLIILFGTKSTAGDLKFLRKQGWHHDIYAHVRQGGRVLGICGGYQMLGQAVHDPDGVEGPPGTVPGLGLLDVETTMLADKQVRPVYGRCAHANCPVSGYEIHVGNTSGPDTVRPFAVLETGTDGAATPDARIQGTYLHGVFSNDAFRTAWLQRTLGIQSSALSYNHQIDQALDDLADAVAHAVDVDKLFNLARIPDVNHV